jgi:hypothetical protein
MADNASVVIQATVLPDDVAKTLLGNLVVEPADADDKWYYKLTTVPNTSQALMAGNFTDYTAVDSATSPVAIVPATDTVKFLFVKNEDTTNDIYISLNGATVTTATADAIKVSAGNSVALEVPNTTVANITAITSAGDVTCQVAAMVRDV